MNKRNKILIIILVIITIISAVFLINNNKNKYKSDRDYSNFDWTSLYANNF